MIVMSDVSGRARPAGRESAALVAGKYHLLTELGRGGMAVVHAAIATGMGGFTKLVVLKRARAADLADRPEAVRTSLNEARISARMNHPNVVQVYEVYEEQGLPVIVMEYLDGQPLSLLLSRHFKDPTSLPELPLNVLCRALEGLQYAHSLADFDGRPLNLIHRDVSPQNIMVTYDGQVKLLDFGIAKLDQASGDTKTGMIKGKVAYMPPEQIEGSELDGRTDLFAIGVMIWEVAARMRMWGSQGDAAVIRRLSLLDVHCLRSAAPEASKRHHALSLIGEPKYQAGFAHFDWVNPDAPKGGTLNSVAPGTFDSFNPYIVRGSPAAGLVQFGGGLLYDTLMEQSIDEPSVSHPLIADAYKFPDDYSSATYRIDPKARWHDGKPITVEDVVWSFQVLKANSPMYNRYYENVTEAVALNDREVEFRFDQKGNRELPKIIGDLAILPKHWWEGVDASGKKRDITQPTLEPPLGSAAYKIESFKPGSEIVWSRA